MRSGCSWHNRTGSRAGSALVSALVASEALTDRSVEGPVSRASDSETARVNALVVAAVVRKMDNVLDIAICDQFYKTRRQKAASAWGEGRALKIRVEPEEEAYTYGQIKHYWGHVITPFCETTGYHKDEAHTLLKAECMPEGKTSITELSGEELRAYSEAAEQKAREWCPDAFVLYDRTM